MAALADAIELFVHVLSKDASKKPECEQKIIQSGMGVIYVLFAFCWLVIWTKHSDKSFGSILTAGAVMQLMGFCMLTLKVRASKSVAGISSRTLEMYLLFFLCRLPATCMMTGYIPVDRSGKFIYQALDVASAFLVLQLLYCVHSTHKHTYQEEQDSMPILPLIPPCVVLAYFIHADFNRSAFFDVLWTTSTYLDTAAMLPQLWMMSKVGGTVHGCTGHFIAALAASRACAFAFWVKGFWVMAHSERESEQFVGNSLAAKFIIGANVLQLLLSADFLYYYLKAQFKGKTLSVPSVDSTSSYPRDEHEI